MKPLIFFFSFLFLCAASSLAQPAMKASKPNPESTPQAKFAFDEVSVDLGAIPRNKPVQVDFDFQNAGELPLVIKNVRTNCGCTEVKFPREPVMPGKSGTLTVTYDASDSGVFNKKITVLANTAEGMHVLNIRGSIKE